VRQWHGSNVSKRVAEEELESGSLIQEMVRCWSSVSFVTTDLAVLTTVEVSASEEIQDDLRTAVRGYLDEKVRLLELDYLPLKI
jgi:hypothetical protein